MRHSKWGYPLLFQGVLLQNLYECAKGGNDIPLASSLRESCYKNHLFMGWYFSRHALGYSPEMTAQVIAAQGIHRETARYIRLDRGLYRYCGSHYLLYQYVSTAQASHKS